MNKKIISIFLLYFLQFFATSCCECDPVRTYERTYNSLELKTWNTSGFQSMEVSNSAPKNSFGLTIAIEFELNQVSYHKSKLDFSSFGYTSTYASSCDCLPDEYINIDPIDSITIVVTNAESKETIDVTNNFTTYGYDGEELTISKLFKNRADWHDGFQVDMTEYDNIPDISIFTVKIILDSGTEIIKQTQEINFK